MKTRTEKNHVVKNIYQTDIDFRIPQTLNLMWKIVQRQDRKGIVDVLLNYIERFVVS